MGDQQVNQGMVAWHMAGMIIASLLVVYVLTRLGFRFVISAGVGGV